MPTRIGEPSVYTGRVTEPATQPGAGRPLHILFVFRSLRGYLRFYDPVVRLLVANGHDVHLVVEMPESEHTHERRWLSEMDAYENFTWEVANLLRRDRWYKPSKAVRQALDYARVMGSEFDNRGYFRRRGKGRTPAFVQRILAPRPMRSRLVLGAVTRALAVVDAAMPMGREIRRFLASRRVDVLVISPHLPPGSLHSQYVTQAQRLSIPAVLCVASWDNLSSKQLIRAVPERTLVWNDEQVREAVEIHHLPAERIAVTGAQVFDYWLDARPSPREQFCERAGLDPGRPYILYVGGALAKAERTEAQWVQEWIERLRSSGRTCLERVGILVRPHPKRNPEWEAVDLERQDGVVVFPHGWLQMPLAEDLRLDYVNSIVHSSAVVGLNSTALIEAAIAGRPVYTILPDEFHDSQFGVFHFEYLLEGRGGHVRAARTFEEHFAQLAAGVEGNDAEAAERAQRFVASFVRPQGERSATPLLVESIEEVAVRGREMPLREPLWVRPLRLAIIVGVYLTSPRDVWLGVSLRWGRLRSLRRRHETASGAS